MSQESSKTDSASKPYPEMESPSPEQGKIAEAAVAVYAVRATPRPRMPVRTVAGLAADDEVWAFVKANNLLPSLEKAIRLTQETFPNLREIKLSYEPDPELPFFDAVVIYAKAVGTVAELFEQENIYVRAFVRSIPYNDSHKIVMLLGVA